MEEVELASSAIIAPDRNLRDGGAVTVAPRDELHHIRASVGEGGEV